MSNKYRLLLPDNFSEAGWAVIRARSDVEAESFPGNIAPAELHKRLPGVHGIALGATRSDVMRLVMRMGLGLVVLGSIIGLVLAVIATRVLTLTNQLGNIQPNDPLTFALVFVVVGVAGFLACYFPARRATKVDPMVALRTE